MYTPFCHIINHCRLVQAILFKPKGLIIKKNDDALNLFVAPKLVAGSDFPNNG
jgi:hypothetical protein